MTVPGVKPANAGGDAATPGIVVISPAVRIPPGGIVGSCLMK